MFFEYKSTSLFELAKFFAKKANALRFGRPFAKTWVVVQNKEAQQWLTLQVAKAEDIAFNVEFILPSELMWKLYRIEHQDLPTSLPSDRIAMHWQLFEVLKSKGGTFGLSSLPEQDKGLFQLAGQIADVMDLYQVFRPELLDSWERGQLTTIEPSEKWQMKIWRELNLIWKEKNPSVPNRKQAFYELRESFSRGEINLESYPDSIFVFGLSQISSSFLDMITSLSKYIDIHFFDVNLKAETKEFENEFSEWLKPKEDSEKLLKNFIAKKKIQYSLERLPATTSDSVLTKISNSSPVFEQTIELHSCHNPKREVEVLKDYLLATFDENKELNPEDILVLVPEMEEYASIIESVFQGEENELRIPVYAPSKYSSQSQMAFIAFLELISSNFKITEVLDFLEIEVVRTSFDFSEEDIFTLKNWLLKNRIHWGLELSDSIYSIEKAVANFMSGFAMELDDFESYKEFIPFTGIHTSEHAVLAARFSSMLQIFKPIKSILCKDKPFKEWLLETKEWVLNLFGKDEKEVQGLRTTIDRLNEYADLIDSKTEVSFSLFKAWLLEQLSEKKASSSGFGYGVVLSSYIPYRSIPFKKVCVLGMNEGVFPRNATRPGFDLINSYPKPGDRIMKEDDKLLFFELLASTSHSLFISFLGQDQHSENEKLPSILVQKMMDEIERLKPEEHKLHGFDWTYFQEPKSYSQKRKDLGIKVLSTNKKKQYFFNENDLLFGKEAIEQIEINELINFFVHPCKYMLNNELSIHTGFENSAPIDREVFKISDLDKYNLDQLLIEGVESNISVDDLKEYSIFAGFTPQGIPGDHSFEAEFNDVSELLSLAQPYLVQKESKEELDFRIEETRVVGSFNKVYGEKSVFIKAAKLKAKDFVSAWIKHVVLSSSDIQIAETVLIGRDSYNKNQIYTISRVENPQEILKGLINWFKESKNDKSYWAFFPESSKAFMDARNSEKASPLKEAQKKWIGSDYISGEGADFYNSLCWKGENPFELHAFQENSIAFWEPVVTHLKKINR